MIRQAIEQAADRHARIVPVPIYIRRQIRAVRRSQQILRQRLNREPLLSEIAAEAGLDCRRVAELINYEQQPISLETPVGEERSAGTALLEDDTKSAYPEATTAERVQREEVRSALNSLDDRLRLVLQLRFGLAGQAPQSLVEVGRELGVTPERARQLEARALDKLRELAPDLRDYLEVA
jgi:RNA polymerase primary sigma factor